MVIIDIYYIFFYICFGLFIGGLIISIISIFLAGLSFSHSGGGHLDHADHGAIGHLDHADHGAIGHLDHADHGAIGHLDHADHGAIGHLDHADHGAIGHLDHADHGAIGHLDHADNIDHIDHYNLDKEYFSDSGHIDTSGEGNIKDITPAPFMLLFSEFLLVFGLSGILYYYLIGELFRWVIFILTPITSVVLTKMVSKIWKMIAKNRRYELASRGNIIGRIGEVVLDVDEAGGVIKIKDNTPMGFEKMHSKPLNPKKKFSVGQLVYICGIKGDYVLVDDEIKPKEEKIKFCPNCGASIEKEDEEYCEYCGEKLR